jgi:catechol 2,3-dioxygenase-like lactoylglutathione lyase family enzyme
MTPQINIITLGVDDLERSLKFYKDGLNFPTSGIVGTEYEGSENQAAGAVAMFKLQGLTLALYPRTELAKDANHKGNPPNPTEFSLGYFAKSKEEVDKVLELAQEAGATLTDAAHKRPWGIYSGYFKDPDGHLWEVIWSPSS